MKGSDAVYDITVIGDDSRYRFILSPDGKLKQKEVLKKGDKNRIKN